MLVLVANGNDGEEGIFSVGSPATCKNCLGIGAGQNSKDAYDYAGNAVELVVDLPVSCAAQGSTSTNFTFEAVPAGFTPKVTGVLHAALMLATPTDGCGPLTGRNYTDKMVIIARGSCSFALKAYNAQTAGAAGFVVTNNLDTPPFGMGDTPADRQDTPIMIKGVMVSKAAGKTLKTQSAECQLHEVHEPEETYWSTIDETPPPGLPEGVWSGVSSGESIGCVSFTCERLGSQNISCVGSIMNAVMGGNESEATPESCDEVTLQAFDITISTAGLQGFEIDVTINALGATYLSRGIARWKANELEIVMVGLGCAADIWCEARSKRPSDFDEHGNYGFVGYAMTMPADGAAFANPFAVPAVMDMLGNAFQKSRLVTGLVGSLAMAHTTKFNSTNLAGFTSRGPTFDGRIKPDVTAPGHTIFSTYSDGEAYTHQCGQYGEEEGSTVTTMSGTSMATPITAGSAALVRQYFADGWLNYNLATVTSAVTLAAPMAPNAEHSFNPSSSLVRAVLINSADDMQGYVQVAAGGGMYKIPQAPSFYQGYGRIHLSNTLCLASHSTDCSLYVLEAANLSHSAPNHQLRVTAPAGSKLRVTLVWTDPPGNPAAAHALVNDLDLSVSAADSSKTYIGNHGLYGDSEHPDGFNNEEQVVVQSLTGGEYDVLVHWARDAVQSNFTTQSFTLVISADQAGMQVQDNLVPALCPGSPIDASGVIVQCSGNGQCNSGVCECYQGFVGASCVAAACGGQSAGLGGNCSNAGSCIMETGRCNCKEGRFGPACQFGPCGGHLELSAAAGEEVEFRSTMMPSSGDITGLGLDAMYNNNMVCEWILSVPEGLSVELSFSFFSTEAGYDFLNIFDGVEPGHGVLQQLTGEIEASKIVSSGNELRIKFESDQTETKAGFSATFRSTLCHGGCSGSGVCVESATDDAESDDESGTEVEVGHCECDAGYYGNNCQLQLGETAQCSSLEQEYPDVVVSTTCEAVAGLGGTYTYNAALAGGSYTHSETGATFICIGNTEADKCFLNKQTPLGGGHYSLMPVFQATCEGPCGVLPPSAGWSAVEGECDASSTLEMQQLQISSEGCSNNGLCSAGGVCECDDGYFTSSHAVTQCDSMQQCGAPYEFTALDTGGLTLSSTRGPSNMWSGVCQVHLNFTASTNYSAGTTIGFLFSMDLASIGAYDSLVVEYVSHHGTVERANIPNLTEALATNSTDQTQTGVLERIFVPSSDVTIQWTVGSEAHDWSLFLNWGAGQFDNIPTMSPTGGEDEEPTSAPTVWDGKPSSAPTAGAPTEAPTLPVTPVRSHALGQVRLTGYLTYEQVSDKRSTTYREFVNMFESDVESFERQNGRTTHCIVENLREGSVIVEFSLTVMMGSSTEAAEGLLQMQRAIDAGTMTQLAGSPLDPYFPLITAKHECTVCQECGEVVTGSPTDSPSSAPTAELLNCFTSDEISGNGVMLGCFVGIAILLGVIACGYLAWWGYHQWMGPEGLADQIHKPATSVAMAVGATPDYDKL